MNDVNKENVKNIEDNDKLFKLYTFAEIAYQNQFKGDINDIESLYPEGWYKDKNYKEKIKIIAEAIKEKTLIINTFGYKALIEREKKKKLFIKE